MYHVDPMYVDTHVLIDIEEFVDIYLYFAEDVLNINP